MLRVLAQLRSNPTERARNRLPKYFIKLTSLKSRSTLDKPKEKAIKKELSIYYLENLTGTDSDGKDKRSPESNTGPNALLHPIHSPPPFLAITQRPVQGTIAISVQSGSFISNRSRRAKNRTQCTITIITVSVRPTQALGGATASIRSSNPLAPRTTGCSDGYACNANHASE